jgi:metal-dependent HD superfamily phosphatase/phosphodiesterase
MPKSKTAAQESTKASPLTLKDLRADDFISTLITGANEHLRAVGYTEHGHRHAGLVANIARNILRRLEYPERDAEVAAMAAYLHDIGNIVARDRHWIAGATMALAHLRAQGVDADEVLTIANAIGNHEETSGDISSPVAAAVVIADKSDVHRSRVQNPEPATFDIHDRVNYAVEHSFVRVDPESRSIALELTIDTEVSSVMEYFEIFLSRMVMCRQAARSLGCTFELVANEQRLA